LRFRRGGLDIIKLTKTSHIHSASRFNLGGLGALFGRAKPTKAPRGDGTAYIVAKQPHFATIQPNPIDNFIYGIKYQLFMAKLCVSVP